MLNLLYEALPDSILVDGEAYYINTDFKYWIELSDALNAKQVDKEYLTNVILSLFVDKIPTMSSKAFEAIMTFFNGNVDDAKQGSSAPKRTKKVYDFKIDCDYFISSFLIQYQIDLTKDDLHWWKFLSLFNGLDKCELTERIHYRSVDLSSIKDKQERDKVRKIQNSLKLDNHILSDEDIGGVLW